MVECFCKGSAEHPEKSRQDRERIRVPIPERGEGGRDPGAEKPGIPRELPAGTPGLNAPDLRVQSLVSLTDVRRFRRLHSRTAAT
ncbi:hypothetical protein GCM10010462_02640 [Microbacterium dextranolyticum]|uniref:Uncharacterized protein n=1 Tax=Microbacterium dextranolyticum TaxID=36806 RepID=A0A9W6HMX4_9MICO|nr:hypothetical protein GCM10017591_17290 [Microbacterium dextranolyticum]